MGHTNTSICVQVSPGCYRVTVFGLDADGRVKDFPEMTNKVNGKGDLIQSTIIEFVTVIDVLA